MEDSCDGSIYFQHFFMISFDFCVRTTNTFDENSTRLAVVHILLRWYLKTLT